MAPLAADRLGDNLDGRNVLPHDEKRNYGAVVCPGKDTSGYKFKVKNTAFDNAFGSYRISDPLIMKSL